MMKRFVSFLLCLAMLLTAAAALADHGEADFTYGEETFHLVLKRLKVQEDKAWVTIDGFTNGVIYGSSVWNQKQIVNVALAYGEEEKVSNITLDYKDERGRAEFGINTTLGLPDEIRLYPADSSEYVVIWDKSDPIPEEEVKAE